MMSPRSLVLLVMLLVGAADAAQADTNRVITQMISRQLVTAPVSTARAIDLAAEMRRLAAEPDVLPQVAEQAHFFARLVELRAGVTRPDGYVDLWNEYCSGKEGADLFRRVLLETVTQRIVDAPADPSDYRWNDLFTRSLATFLKSSIADGKFDMSPHHRAAVHALDRGDRAYLGEVLDAIEAKGELWKPGGEAIAIRWVGHQAESIRRGRGQFEAAARLIATHPIESLRAADGALAIAARRDGSLTMEQLTAVLASWKQAIEAEAAKSNDPRVWRLLPAIHHLGAVRLRAELLGQRIDRGAADASNLVGRGSWPDSLMLLAEDGDMEKLPDYCRELLGYLPRDYVGDWNSTGSVSANRLQQIGWEVIIRNNLLDAAEDYIDLHRMRAKVVFSPSGSLAPRDPWLVKHDDKIKEVVTECLVIVRSHFQRASDPSKSQRLIDDCDRLLKELEEIR